MGSYVAGESCLTCCRRCRCCCCVCGRCGLTNRSTAVADAEPPPPMIPVANRGPRFESILATSRDSRFSSFKKADVDMCQSLLFRPTAINQPSLQPSATRLNGFEIFHPFFPREISFFQEYSFLRSLALLFLEKNFRTVFLSSFWLFLFKGEETKCRVGSLLGFSNCNGDFRRGKCASGEKRSSREIIWNMCARICFREEKKLLIKARESFRLIEFCLIFYGERFFLSSVWGQGSDVFSIKIYTWTLTVDININFEFQLLKLNENVARFCFFEFKFKTSPLPLSPSPPKIQI